ncbi:RTG1 [Cyberlindnera jadinii]|uniref:RTG1 protein n=1 Tax=Cyberlindnera jadinii (strain ATCC 18201 / CBS 1600 / BCRC 20928 / JCM 3617 / NBRC 0987 / NRRL Y-1542) TaxID=983966 RepID=A0A0H5CIW2_CYBJN|nr:hypothetical protein CYBJADRAFT_167884 [Cyberlindnera jadinii NRRL Y-1542]ODV73296.1 hypothetical protein CYBJADRAFT_167884 [Cyberlindnera jadinii NRRL Y-1542]CEP24499.1 RTG1 [Cyberlindnera jadinii]
MDTDDLLGFSTSDVSSNNTRIVPAQSLPQNFSQSLSSSFPNRPKTLSESFQDGKITKAPSRRKSVKKEDNDDDEEESQDRKRRDNMNEKIQELLALIPDHYFSDPKDKSSGTKDGKPNKGQILTKGVEYIQDLQNKIDENNRKEVGLVWKLKKLIDTKGIQVNDINLSNTSAEVVLAGIGVGPLAGTQEPPVKKSPNNNFEYGGYDQYS